MVNIDYVYKTPMKVREWRASPKGHKSHRISMWRKEYGIICDFEAIYPIYCETNECDFCGIKLIPHYKYKRGYNGRCLDHCHSCGGVRGILCTRCNLQNKLKCELCD